jgi:hypothetical protein
MENGVETRSWLLAKLAGVWTVVGITSWSEAASFMAFCLTCWIFGGHIWRDALRPLLVHFGIVKPLTPEQAKLEAIEDSHDAG